MPYPDYPDWEYVRRETLRGENVPMIDPDQPTFMRRPYAHSKADLEGADVAIIGAPYVQAGKDTYSGIPLSEWVEGPKRVRQQSAKYTSGRMAAFDVDVFEHLDVVDYGDADIPSEIIESYPPNVEQVLEAQRAVERKVTDVREAGAVPIVLGQNSPPGSYGVARPILERTDGDVGVVSLDTHWDARSIDGLTADDRIAGGDSWLAKLYEWHDNAHLEDLVEIGIRGYGDVLDDWRIARESNFHPMWELKDRGVTEICGDLDAAYDDTDARYLHFDMDVMGGGGSAPGDMLGDLAEPMGMTDYEVLKIAHELGRRGFDALSFIAIMPGSAVMYRTVVYVVMYALAGRVLGGAE